MTPTFALLDGLGAPEILVIGIIALLMFGSKRLPEIGRGLGRAMREFKRATSGVEENLREVLREDPTPTVRPAPRQIARGGTTSGTSSVPATTNAIPPAAAASTTTPSAQPPGAAPETPSSDRRNDAEDELAN